MVIDSFFRLTPLYTHMKLVLFVLTVVLTLAGCDNSDFSDTSGEDLLFLESDNAIMPVRVQGNKASNRFVIFLHGGPGGNIVDARDFLDSSMKPIEEEVAMVYWDQRCAGSSQGNCNRHELSFDTYLLDLDRLLVLLRDQYGSDLEFYLLTHSFGGWLATVYLSDWDDERNIKGWMNMDGAFSAPLIFESSKEMIIEVANRQIAVGNNVEKWEEKAQEIEQLDLFVFEDQVMINSIGYEVEQYMTDVDSVNTPETEGTLATIFTSPGSPLAIVVNNMITEASPFNTEVFGLDHSSKLAGIDIPIMLLWGKYDFVVPPSTMDEFERQVGSQDVTRVVFERSGHTPMVTEPEKFAESVVRFIQRISPE